MGILEDSLDKAAAANFTRPIPKSARAQMRFLVKQEKGSTKAVAQLLGTSQRTVERYLKGQFKQPRGDLAARLVSEVNRRWQPRVRDKAKKQAATSGGIVIETRARFGYTAAPGTTDDARIRLITQHLPPHTRPASSTPKPPEPVRSSCATSQQKDCRRSTSRTAGGAPTTSKSRSPTSITSRSASRQPVIDAARAVHVTERFSWPVSVRVGRVSVPCRCD